MKINEKIEDEYLLTLAEERMKNIDKDNLISAQEVFDELGITEEDLNAIDETEIEFE
ncbi:MAG: hypothetical protein R3Y27_04575 [Clostridia bacterium]